MSHPNTNAKLCQSKNVQAFFDDELEPAMQDPMRTHIAECSVCAAEVRALRHLQALVGLAFGLTSDLTTALQRYPLTSH
jgi:anti-sigma factor RsiW